MCLHTLVKIQGCLINNFRPFSNFNVTDQLNSHALKLFIFYYLTGFILFHVHFIQTLKYSNDNKTFRFPEFIFMKNNRYYVCSYLFLYPVCISC